MSNIRQLTREMHQLQGQIARLQRESEDRDRKYQQEHKMRMHQLKRTMENAMERHNTQLMQQTQREMDALNRELMERIQRNHEALKRELTENLEVRHQQLLNQIQQYYRDIQRRIDTEITDVMKESDEEKIRQANLEYQAAVEQYQILGRRAHEELFPGRLAVFDQTIQQAHRMMTEQRQYEASIATSIMLKVDLKDMEYSINEKLSEWLASFLRMEQSYIRISEKMEQEILLIDDRRISEDTAMHWTDHKFDMVFGCLKRVKEILDEMEIYRRRSGEEIYTAEAVEAYIKTGDAPVRRELEENTRVLSYEIPGKLQDMNKEMQSAFRCSEQRKVWAEKIAEYMEQKHNTGAPVYDGFHETPSEMEEPDPKALYCLEFEKPVGNGRYNHIIIHIVPIYEKGEVTNHIRIFMDYQYGSTSYQRTQETRMITGILKAAGEKKLFIAVGTDSEILQGNCDEEYSIQKSSDGAGELLVNHSRQKNNTVKQEGMLHERRYGRNYCNSSGTLSGSTSSGSRCSNRSSGAGNRRSSQTRRSAL